MRKAFGKAALAAGLVLGTVGIGSVTASAQGMPKITLASAPAKSPVRLTYKSENGVPHVTLTYRVAAMDQTEKGSEFTRTYAITESISRDLRNHKDMSGEQMAEWIELQGGRLDSSLGPAFISRDDDGSTQTAYYRNGVFQRAKAGPAGPARKP
jgi:hypothetical protein